jgi:prepilin-type N-terminal cleavage/methylation domain-containing protein
MNLRKQEPIGHSLQNAYGFTVLEIIAVLIVLGVLVAMSTSYFSTQTTEQQAYTDTIKSHLRYAQLMAMKGDVVCGINFTGTTYSLFRNGSTGDTVFLPGDDSASGALPTGKSATEIVAFDSWGIPYTNASGTTAHSGGSVGNLSITITPNTGFIP